MNTLRSLMVGILILLALITVPVTALAAIDATPPTTSATLTGTKGSDGWYTTSVTVTLAASDVADGSGVAKTEYSLDKVTWQPYSAPFVLDKDGGQFVHFRSTDNAGNLESPAKSQEIKINKTGQVGLWHLDGDWNDASAVGNNGIPFNGAKFSANAKVGSQAGSFGGVNDYVQIPNTPALNPSKITVELWAKSNVATWNSYGSMASKRDAYILHPMKGSKEIRFYGFINGSWQRVSYNNPNLDITQWHHYVGTYDGVTLNIYVDGVKSSLPLAGSINTADTGALYLGSDEMRSESYFNGLLDEVSIYSRVLTDVEVQQHYRDFVVSSPKVNPVPSLTTSATITLSGTKPANTAIAINGNTLVALNGATTWQAIYTLSAGTNNLSITALDSKSFSSLPVILTVVLDTTPPVAPIIDPVSAPINATSITITGSKSSDSASVVVSCAGATIGTIAYPTATTWSVDVSGLKEGSNTITAYAVDTAGNTSATAAAAITVDTTPPAVGAMPAGGIYSSAQSVSLAVNEQAVIYYTTDGSTPTESATVYSHPIAIPAGATLKYFARDLAGNNSELKTENYVIDTTSPVLAISTLSDGAYTNNETLNIAGTVMDDTELTGVTVNDTAVQVNAEGSFSYALLLKNGANIITIAARDSVGNMAADIRTVTLDQTAPVLAVTTPADNSKTGKMLLEVSGTVDETSAVTVKIKDLVQSALMSGGTFTATVILEPGYNTIEITAVDLAGNRSTLKRTVVFDDHVPSLAVIVPSQDIRTNQRSLTIKGTVSHDLTAVGVTINKDNEIFTPPVIDGQFEQAVNFVEEKTYGIVVTATNEVGTSTSVQRNFIYDITPPALSIDPVISPTSQSSLSVTGTREAGTVVAVTCITATVGEVSYPTATTWLAYISGLREGENIIAAASADAAGNAVTATAAVVLASKPPEITITATPDVIWPPNHKMVPVTIAGGVESYGSAIKSVLISVSDEYGKLEYNNLTFGSTVMLEAWRNGNDTDGRKYTITVIVADRWGVTTAKTATVKVPHSQNQDQIQKLNRHKLMPRPSKGASPSVRTRGNK